MSFEQAMQGSDVIFILGTGVSASLSANAPTSTWLGLVQSGARRARDLDPNLGDGWASLVEGLLNYGNKAGRTNEVVQAAGMVANALRGISPQAFARWLADDVGALELKDRTLADAILSYPFPIITTNYDDLLERAGGRESRDWTDSRFQEVAARSSDAIGHLHGVWDKPDSVVLSESDYQRLRDHASTQALERAITSLKSIVYVGFGAGIADPNFSGIYEWQRAVFPTSTVTHYRLCLESELDDLIVLHSSDNVEPISYGSHYDELPGFLARLAPDRSQMVINDVGLARDVVQEVQAMLVESMVSDSVLVDLLPADREVGQLVFPPALLPVPHSRFVREQLRNGGTTSAGRLDPFDEVKAHDLLVVVGDDGSGLTTAVKWLASESSNVLGSAAPLFVRFRDCRNRRDPLGVAVANVARQAGLIAGRDDPVPAHVLAIDDFDPALTKISEPALGAIASGLSIVTVIGCREGNEDELVRDLKARGLSPRLVFLGRMSRPDIAKLAEGFAPNQGERLAKEVIDHLESNGLKRTPLTVGLVLALLTKSGLQDSKNTTSILDAYVELILSTGDPHEFPRGLSDRDVQAILARLAEYVVWEERSSIAEAEAIDVVQQVIQGFGWSANPAEVVRFLIKRRVLRERSEGIEFGRYAYLTTFAAKRATSDADFRDLILDDPFYYAPVVKRYAALVRSDEELLEKIFPLFQEALAESLDDGTPYELTSSDPIESAEERQFDGSDNSESRPDDEDPDIELPERDYAGSFGLVRSAMPVASRLHRTLDLVSRVLRDLDQVERLDLKRDYLMKALTLWGRLVAALSSDPALVEMRDAILRQLTEDDDTKRADIDYAEFLGKALPAATVMAGIEAALVSTKLSRLMADSLDAGEINESTERETAAMFMFYLLRSNGWAFQAERVARQASPTWVVTQFFHSICRDVYVSGEEPEADIMSLCKTLAALGQHFSSPSVRGAWIDRYAHDLRLQRLKRGHTATTVPAEEIQ